jgi:hypothetical protein
VELPDDRSELHAFQVLSHPRKMLGIQTFDTDPFQERRVWNLQPLEIVNAQDLSVDPMQLDVHDAHESREIDLVGMLSADIESRNDVRLWDTTQSDYGGCTALVNSRLATPLSPIISKSFPLVGLWDMLEVAGFMRVHRVVKHSVRSGKFYDEAGALSRLYLRAVLSSKWLFDNGQATFESRKAASYYALILKQPGKVPDNLDGPDYLLALKGVSPEDALVAITELPAQQPPKRRRLVDPDVDGGPLVPIGGASDADGRSESVHSPSESGRGSDTGGSGGSSSSSSSDSNSSVDGESEEGPGFPARLCGNKLKREVHKDTGDEGLRIRCPHHSNCRRFRGLNVDIAEFGVQGVFFFSWCLV